MREGPRLPVAVQAALSTAWITTSQACWLRFDHLEPARRNRLEDKTKLKQWTLKKLEVLKTIKTGADGSVLALAMRHAGAVRQSAAARQSVSESIQNGLKFRLTFHKSAF